MRRGIFGQLIHYLVHVLMLHNSLRAPLQSQMTYSLSFLLLLLLLGIGRIAAFVPTGNHRTPISLLSSSIVPSLTNGKVSEIRNYEYDSWKLTYRYKPASPGYENDDPILLIHPVGIGLASWFWERLMAEWTGPELYAPNLIGCGISEGGDTWDPDQRGLSFPLGWVQGCEALIKSAQRTSNRSGLLFFGGNQRRKWTVLSQGGLAPVGVMLAARNADCIHKLILASPPTWKDMTTAVPESELTRNYNFLRNPIWGRFAFQLLESRQAIQFFSNQFLFSKPCDEAWLDNAENELGPKARPPVICFNSGFCQHRSFEEELRSLPQPTLILAGDGDKRNRQEYQDNMKECQLQIIPGLNVVPWESPIETVRAIKDFLSIYRQ